MSAASKPLLALGVPRPRKRAWFALFLLAVGAILGGVPGWRMVFASWLVFSWFLLACVIAASLLYALGRAVERAWAPMRVELGQACYLVLAGLTFPLMFELPAWVDLVASRSRLESEAAAAANAGAARFAVTHAYDGRAEGGTVYDPSGQIAEPVDRRSQKWHDSVAVRFWMDRDCVEIRHLIGPDYHWSDGCGPF